MAGQVGLGELECAADSPGVHVEERPNRGCCLVASRRLRAGSEIFRGGEEAALAVVGDDLVTSSICAGCMCSESAGVVEGYCSVECASCDSEALQTVVRAMRRAAAVTPHAAKAHQRMLQYMMALRTTRCADSHAPPPPGLLPPTCETLAWHDCASAPMDLMANSAIVLRAQQAPVVAAADLQPLYSNESALQALSVLQCNAMAIVSDDPATSTWRGNRPEERQGHKVGVGLFPRHARMNHSCRPTASLYFSCVAARRPRVHARLLRNVEAGEEITITYVDLFATRAARRDELRRRYHFECVCERCGPATSDEARVACELSGVRDGMGGDAEEEEHIGCLERTIDELLELKLGEEDAALETGAAAAAAAAGGHTLDTALARVAHASAVLVPAHAVLVRARRTIYRACMGLGRFDDAAQQVRAERCALASVLPLHHPDLAAAAVTLAHCIARSASAEALLLLLQTRFAYKSIAAIDERLAPLTSPPLSLNERLALLKSSAALYFQACKTLTVCRGDEHILTVAAQKIATRALALLNVLRQRLGKIKAMWAVGTADQTAAVPQESAPPEHH